ncbi:hypothetical protein CYMTET_12079, partial [Cymbomonas tetramitiformis]
ERHGILTEGMAAALFSSRDFYGSVPQKNYKWKTSSARRTTKRISAVFIGLLLVAFCAIWVAGINAYTEKDDDAYSEDLVDISCDKKSKGGSRRCQEEPEVTPLSQEYWGFNVLTNNEIAEDADCTSDRQYGCRCEETYSLPALSTHQWYPLPFHRLGERGKAIVPMRNLLPSLANHTHFAVMIKLGYGGGAPKLP